MSSDTRHQIKEIVSIVSSVTAFACGEKNKKACTCSTEAKQSRPVPQSAYERSWQPSSAIACPSLLARVCRWAARSTAFPTPQGFKWGICHSTGNGGWEESYSAGRNRRQTAPNAVAFNPPHGERSSRARVPVPRHSHRGSLATK
jgi:hypothetical protein